jgi:tetratricopeptide (TPR) repeat protein
MIRHALLLPLALFAPLALADVATARRQVEAQQLDAAQATLDAHLIRQPDDSEAQFLLARVLAWQGKPEQALPIYQQLLQREPDNADFLLGQGQALLWAGRPQIALDSLERAARIAPDYAEVQQVMQQARAALTSPVTTTAPPASAPAQRRHELELSARQDWLDSSFDNWRSQRLDYASTQPEGLGWYGALLREQRFGEWDQVPSWARCFLWMKTGRYNLRSVISPRLTFCSSGTPTFACNGACRLDFSVPSVSAVPNTKPPESTDSRSQPNATGTPGVPATH